MMAEMFYEQYRSRKHFQSRIQGWNAYIRPDYTSFSLLNYLKNMALAAHLQTCSEFSAGLQALFGLQIRRMLQV